MKAFKVGDRVAVYGGLHNTPGSACLDGQKATVANAPYGNEEFKDNVWVEFDWPVGDDKAAWVHPKQCRLLKPAKTRKRLYALVPSYGTHWVSACYDLALTNKKVSAYPGQFEVQEFVQVRRRKA